MSVRKRKWVVWRDPTNDDDVRAVRDHARWMGIMDPSVIEDCVQVAMLRAADLMARTEVWRSINVLAKKLELVGGSMTGERAAKLVCRELAKKDRALTLPRLLTDARLRMSGGLIRRGCRPAGSRLAALADCRDWKHCRTDTAYRPRRTRKPCRRSTDGHHASRKPNRCPDSGCISSGFSFRPGFRHIQLGIHE
jgi:hypothetical protein